MNEDRSSTRAVQTVSILPTVLVDITGLLDANGEGNQVSRENEKS